MYSLFIFLKHISPDKCPLLKSQLSPFEDVFSFSDGELKKIPPLPYHVGFNDQNNSSFTQHDAFENRLQTTNLSFKNNYFPIKQPALPYNSSTSKQNVDKTSRDNSNQINNYKPVVTVFETVKLAEHKEKKIDFEKELKTSHSNPHDSKQIQKTELSQFFFSKDNKHNFENRKGHNQNDANTHTPSTHVHNYFEILSSDLHSAEYENNDIHSPGYTSQNSENDDSFKKTKFSNSLDNTNTILPKSKVPSNQILVKDSTEFYKLSTSKNVSKDSNKDIYIDKYPELQNRKEIENNKSNLFLSEENILINYLKERSCSNNEKDHFSNKSNISKTRQITNPKIYPLNLSDDNDLEINFQNTNANHFNEKFTSIKSCGKDTSGGNENSNSNKSFYLNNKKNNLSQLECEDIHFFADSNSKSLFPNHITLQNTQLYVFYTGFTPPIIEDTTSPSPPCLLPLQRSCVLFLFAVPFSLPINDLKQLFKDHLLNIQTIKQIIIQTQKTHTHQYINENCLNTYSLIINFYSQHAADVFYQAWHCKTLPQQNIHNNWGYSCWTCYLGHVRGVKYILMKDMYIHSFSDELCNDLVENSSHNELKSKLKKCMHRGIEDSLKDGRKCILNDKNERKSSLKYCLDMNYNELKKNINKGDKVVENISKNIQNISENRSKIKNKMIENNSNCTQKLTENNSSVIQCLNENNSINTIKLTENILNCTQKITKDNLNSTQKKINLIENEKYQNKFKARFYWLENHYQEQQKNHNLYHSQIQKKHIFLSFFSQFFSYLYTHHHNIPFCPICLEKIDCTASGLHTRLNGWRIQIPILIPFFSPCISCKTIYSLYINATYTHKNRRTINLYTISSEKVNFNSDSEGLFCFIYK